MGAVKNHYWEDLMARSDNCEDMEFAAREIEKDESDENDILDRHGKEGSQGSKDSEEIPL